MLDALPGMVERGARSAEALEAIRARAADALGEMQATIRTLGTEPPNRPPDEMMFSRIEEVMEEKGTVEPSARRLAGPRRASSRVGAHRDAAAARTRLSSRSSRGGDARRDARWFGA